MHPLCAIYVPLSIAPSYVAHLFSPVFLWVFPLFREPILHFCSGQGEGRGVKLLCAPTLYYLSRCPPVGARAGDAGRQHGRAGGPNPGGSMSPGRFER